MSLWKSFVLLLLALVGASALYASISSFPRRWSIETSMEERFEQWMSQYGRVYKDEVEKKLRFRVFKDKVEYVEALNKQNLGYTVGVNNFADLTFKEFEAAYLHG
ncbi:hypothetical protein Droror1_Dr00007574 [Drosera rotundifolia]